VKDEHTKEFDEEFYRQTAELFRFGLSDECNLVCEIANYQVPAHLLL
jgi:hypothetical protein